MFVNQALSDEFFSSRILEGLYFFNPKKGQSDEYDGVLTYKSIEYFLLNLD